MTFLARKRLATRSTLLMTRRPSARTAGRWENFPSSRTIWATALVAWAPLFMATPMSASLMARASFTPSPVMATMCPSACRACTRARFCSGLTRPKTVVSRATARSASTSVPRSRASRRRLSGTSSPTLRAMAPTVSGVVAADDLDVDALGREVVEGVLGVRAHLLGERDQGQGPDPGRELVTAQRRIAVRQQPPPVARSSPSPAPRPGGGRRRPAASRVPPGRRSPGR